MQQCELESLTWEGGTGPFRLQVTPLDEDGRAAGASRQLGGTEISRRSYTWRIDYAAGTRLRIQVLPPLERYYATATLTVLTGSDDCALYGESSGETTTRITATSTTTSASPRRITYTFATSILPTSEEESPFTDQDLAYSSLFHLEQPDNTTGDRTTATSTDAPRTTSTTTGDPRSLATSTGDSRTAAASTGQSRGNSSDGVAVGAGPTVVPEDRDGGSYTGGELGGSGSHSSDVGAIVGGVMGTVLGLALIAALLVAWLYTRRGRETARTHLLDIDAETTQAMEPVSHPVTPYTPTTSSDRAWAPEESPLSSAKEAPSAPPEPSTEEEFAIDAGPVREQRPPRYNPNWSSQPSK